MSRNAVFWLCVLSGALALVSAGLRATALTPAAPAVTPRIIAPPISCLQLDFELADWRLFYASSNLSGRKEEAEMWLRVIREEEARPCYGPRMEEEQ